MTIVIVLPLSSNTLAVSSTFFSVWGYFWSLCASDFVLFLYLWHFVNAAHYQIDVFFTCLCFKLHHVS